MPKLPGINHQDAIRVLTKLGYWIERQSGHIVMANGVHKVVIPRGNPINAYTMGGIAESVGLTPTAFRKLL